MSGPRETARAGQPATAAVPAAEPAARDSPLFRVFLVDGSSIASVGEFARVGDRVVLSLPLSPSRQPIASLPAAQVDWTRTERYAESVRAARYAASRGEADFAAMSALVARTLSDIAITPGLQAQLALAERARRTLADWPRDHFGFRAEEVRQTLALLDEVVAGLRASAGETRFDVSLVAGTAPPPAEPSLPVPTLREAIEQALRLSDLAASPAERVSLIEQARGALAEAVPASVDPAWADGVQRRLERSLERERRTDRAYRDLATATMRSVERRAARTDVRGLLRVRAQVVERDRSLGRRRPGEIQALLATIDERLDATRRLRLAEDRWTTRLPVLRAYEQTVKPALDRLRAARAVLADIRSLAGPSLPALAALVRQLDAVGPVVRAMSVPEEAHEAHAAIRTALQLASTAAHYRQRAIANNDMRAAWDGSAAAAGALLFFERADSLVAALRVRPASTVPARTASAADAAPPGS